MGDIFRLATDSDLDAVWLLFRKAIENLQRHQIDQWDDTYPDRRILAEDIAKRQMHVLVCDGNIVSVIVLNEEQNDAYETANWEDLTGKFAVIHRLCVHPDYQGRGIGRETVYQSQNFLSDTGYTSIRLDAFRENKKSLDLYEGMGYVQRGTAIYRKGVFNLYEKRL